MSSSAPVDIDFGTASQQRLSIDFNDEMPRMGHFGAPKCRLSIIVVAMAAIFIGIIFVGVGACMALFYSHEPIALWPGISLFLVGIILIIGGAFYYACTSMCGGDSIKNAVQRSHIVETATEPVSCLQVQQQRQQHNFDQQVFSSLAPPIYKSIDYSRKSENDLAQNSPPINNRDRVSSRNQHHSPSPKKHHEARNQHQHKLSYKIDKQQQQQRPGPRISSNTQQTAV